MEFTNDIEFNINPTANHDLNIVYHGFLGNSNELSIVYGFNETWENTTEMKMEKNEKGFVANIKMLDFNTFNFCFKNDENIWDNNSNCNYISTIVPTQNEEIVSSSQDRFDALFSELLESHEDVNNQVTETVSFDIDALIEQILAPVMFKDDKDNEEDTNVKIESEPVDLGVEVTNALSKIKFETKSQDLAEFESLDEILSGNVVEEKDIELINDETKNENQETSLISIPDPFIISSRQLSRFYLLRKQIKLILYKVFIKIPKLILGLDED